MSIVVNTDELMPTLRYPIVQQSYRRALLVSVEE